VQSTPPVPSLATAHPVPGVKVPISLVTALASVPDPRRSASVTYPLPAIFALTVTALLANQLSVLAMAEWAARPSPEVVVDLGFRNGRTPCQSTLHRLLRKLDGHALAAALRAHFVPAPVPPTGGRGTQAIAIDGKAPRGRLHFETGGCPVHALSAWCHQYGVVVAHEPITTGGDTAEAELTVAPTLLGRLDWRGRVLTADALFCQRQLCHQVCDAGGDYLLIVKDNQPTLAHDIRLLFDPPCDLATLPLLDQRETWSLETGHGRRDERRSLIASTDLTAYLDWPGLAQVFRVERTWQERGVVKGAVRYGMTSLPPSVATPARLLELRRGHWAIEHRLHRCKDVTMGEDASLIPVGQGPTGMALLRDAAVNLLSRTGVRRVAARLRAYSQQPDRALALVVRPLPTHA
jgi:predicted transposase YbfD/YdcC